MCVGYTPQKFNIFNHRDVFMSNGSGDVDPSRSAVASASTEAPPDSDSASDEAEPFQAPKS